jgi:preprotein translocase subunit SecA
MGAFEDFISGADASKRSKDNQAYLKSLSARVDRINSLESTIEELDDDELQAKTREFRTRLANGEDMNGPLLEEAFAVVREAAWYV